MSLRMILRIFLFFVDFEPGDSYKEDSYNGVAGGSLLGHCCWIGNAPNLNDKISKAALKLHTHLVINDRERERAKERMIETDKENSNLQKLRQDSNPLN